MTAENPVKAAVLNSSLILIDGIPYDLEAYTIDDYNYFRLRDLAYVLNGSPCEFNVGWDPAASIIKLTSGVPYAVTGGELSKAGILKSTAVTTPSVILCDGNRITLTAYLIGDSNYFKLRDLGILFGFDVTWDAESSAVLISTSQD